MDRLDLRLLRLILALIMINGILGMIMTSSYEYARKLGNVRSKLRMTADSISKIVIIPDNRVENPSITWHKWLANKLEAEGIADTGVYGMPNPYEFNTKRYEVKWLEYMRSGLGLAENPERTLVVAHGFAADATLRYLENHQLGKVLLVGPHDMYHAGERHGRDLVWPLIRKNVGSVGLAYGAQDKFVTMQEAQNVRKQLNVHDKFYKEIENESNFFDNAMLEASLAVCKDLLL